MGIVLADGPTLDEGRAEMVYNTGWVTKAYEENYNFSKSPAIPTVWATAGDRKVTLNWDNLAEHTVDPILGEDFEGYRIYRSTDPGWNDCTPITDSYGSTTYRRPVKQFDIDNEFSGISTVPLKGICFDLGENTGLRHTWTDTTVKNGQKYYYAVTAYDHGDPESGIAPSECPKFIAISTGGEVSKGTNVVIVTPEAPSAGFLPSQIATLRNLPGQHGHGFGVLQHRGTHEHPRRPHLPVHVRGHDADDHEPGAQHRELHADGRHRSVRAAPSHRPEPESVGSGRVSDDRRVQVRVLQRGGTAPRRGALRLEPPRTAHLHVRAVPLDEDRRRFRCPRITASNSVRTASVNRPEFIRGTTTFASKPVNFRVYKMIPSDTGEIKTEINFAFIEQDGTDGRFSALHAIRGG